MQLCSILINIILSSDLLYYTLSYSPQMSWSAYSWTLHMGISCLSSRIDTHTSHWIAPLRNIPMISYAARQLLKKHSLDLVSSSRHSFCCIGTVIRCRHSNWYLDQLPLVGYQCHGHSKWSILVLMMVTRFSCRIGRWGLGILGCCKLWRN